MRDASVAIDARTQRSKARKRDKGTVWEELDELALTRKLKKFVEGSDLSIPKIGSEMGVFSATLSMWIAGTTKPSRTDLLAIKSFLERRE